MALMSRLAIGDEMLGHVSLYFWVLSQSSTSVSEMFRSVMRMLSSCFCLSLIGLMFGAGADPLGEGVGRGTMLSPWWIMAGSGASAFGKRSSTSVEAATMSRARRVSSYAPVRYSPTPYIWAAFLSPSLTAPFHRSSAGSLSCPIWNPWAARLVPKTGIESVTLAITRYCLPLLESFHGCTVGSEQSTSKQLPVASISRLTTNG